MKKIMIVAIATLAFTGPAIGVVSDSRTTTRPRPSSLYGNLQSFCGFEFGGFIDDSSKNAVTNSDSNESFSFSMKLPALVSDFTLPQPFRNFKSGKVYAVPRGRQIYKVVFDTYYFQDQTKGSGKDEHDMVLAALKQKYGESNCTSEQNSFGDYKHEFLIGNLKITFEYTTAGVFDKECLDLCAENMQIWNSFESRAKIVMKNACEKAAKEALEKYISGEDEADKPISAEKLIEGADVL